MSITGRFSRALLALLTGLITICTAAPATTAAPRPAPLGQPTTYQNPLVNGQTINPFMVRNPANGTYYAYFNGLNFGGHQNVPTYTSTNLVTWSQHSPLNVLPDANVGSWANVTSGTNFSAPAVLHLPHNPSGSQWVLYYTAVRTSNGQKCIGAATASSPDGPFDDNTTQPLICPTGGAQDPSPIPIGDDPPEGLPIQILYRNNSDGAVYNIVLEPDGLTVPASPLLFELYQPPTSWWHNGNAERPAVTVDADNRVYLFFTAGPLSDQRHVAWASCVTFVGVVVGCQDPDADLRTFVGSTQQVDAPSGVQILHDGDDGQWIVYDAQPGGSCTQSSCTGARTMRIDKLCYAGGEPRTNAPSATSQTLARDDGCPVDVPQNWAVSWAAGLAQTSAAQAFSANTTWRQFVHSSIGGTAVRVRLSNRVNPNPITISAATVAVGPETDSTTAAVDGSPVPLTFNGSGSVTIRAGEKVVSDAVPLPVPQDRDLAVSLHLPNAVVATNLTAARTGNETSWLGTGDLTASRSSGFTSSRDHVYLVEAIDVLDDEPHAAVATVGDSITDGINVLDNEHTWPDLLFDRLGADPDLAVANVGISGDTLANAVTRLDRDALALTGVQDIVVLLGTNDLSAGRTTAQMVADLQQLILLGHQAGVGVIGATIPPAGPSSTITTQWEQTRLEVNERILPGQPDSLDFDAVVDFSAVLADPATSNPVRMRSEYSWFGGVHPNEAGYQVMADAVDLADLVPWQPTTYQNPLVNGQTINPFMVKNPANGTYYAYFNGLNFGGHQNVPTYTSTNLRTWSQHSPLNVLPDANVGSWANVTSGTNFSAPAVLHLPNNPSGSQWVLYYTAVRTSNGNKCIGAATASSPDGPFDDNATQPLICPTGGAQDPSPVPQPDNPPVGLPVQILYRNNSDGAVYNIVLDANGTSAPASPSIYKLYEPTDGWWHNGNAERPAITYDRDDPEDIYLFFTAGPATTPQRAIGWSSCQQGLGIVQTCDVQQTQFGTWIAGTDAVGAPSGVQVLHDGERQWITYDAQPGSSCTPTSCTGPRTMRIDKLCFGHGHPRTNAPSTGAAVWDRFPDCSADVRGAPLEIGEVTQDLVMDQPTPVVNRDGGSSIPHGGSVAWLYSDTIVSGGCPQLSNSLSHGVLDDAATAPNWTTPRGSTCPSALIPYTTAESNYNATNPDHFRMALWELGGVPLPDGGALVFFLKIIDETCLYCYDYQGIGVAHLPPGSTAVNRTPQVSPMACNPDCLFTSAAGTQFERPFLDGDFVYATFERHLARAPLADAEDPAAWRYWTDDPTEPEWTDDFSEIGDVPGIETPPGVGFRQVSYNPYLDRFINVGNDKADNRDDTSDPAKMGISRIMVQTAEHPEGPWTPQVLAYDATVMACQNPNGTLVLPRTGLQAWSLTMNGGRTLPVAYHRGPATGCARQNRLAYLELGG